VGCLAVVKITLNGEVETVLKAERLCPDKAKSYNYWPNLYSRKQGARLYS
jgi:hypothetical protein